MRRDHDDQSRGVIHGEGGEVTAVIRRSSITIEARDAFSVAHDNSFVD
jgi:hypothetical protein